VERDPCKRRTYCLQEAASAANGSREQLLARQDELCRKLNDAEEAAAKTRRKTHADAAAAKKTAEAQLRCDQQRVGLFYRSLL